MARAKKTKAGVPVVPTESETGEAAMEQAWLKSGDLHILADRIGLGLLRGEIPPALAWVHKALLDLANSKVDIKPYSKAARRLVRYIAVREAHDREGLTWEEAPARAAEMLRGEPAAASPDWMWKEYKAMRKAMRDVGAVRDDDDPGYSWVDLSDKSSVERIREQIRERTLRRINSSSDKS